MSSVIPILSSTDLDRTSRYWQALGFEVAERHAGYLVTHAHGVEIHFSHGTAPDRPATESGYNDSPLLFIHVHDAGVLWKRLTDEGISGVGPVQDMDYGLREFVIVDPDGNRARIGSPRPG